jgi:hypothetical protein
MTCSMRARTVLCSLSVLVAVSTAQAQEQQVVAKVEPGRLFVHATMGVNAYSYLGATSSAKAGEVTLASRTTLLQQVGVGYWVHPLLRLQLTAMLAETVSGLPAGGNAFTLASVLALACVTWRGIIAGGGIVVAPRALGSWGANFGLTGTLGYGASLGAGWTLALVAQVPVLLTQRLSVTIAPAVVLGYRF